MTTYLASTQQRAALRLSTTRRRMPAQMDLPGLRAEGTGGTGRLRLVARARVHEAKTAIVAEMRELDRPVPSKELHPNLGGAWSLEAIEYHLSTLVKTRVAEIVFGPELHFSLTEAGGEGSTRERCR